MSGTDVLKKDLKVIIDIAKKAENALEDNKINVIEGVGLAITAVKAWKVAKDYKVLKEQYEDLDEAEIKDLHEYFVTEFDLKNDKIEDIIEQVFLLLLNMSNIISAVK